MQRKEMKSLNVFNQRPVSVEPYLVETSHYSHTDSTTGSTLRFGIKDTKIRVIGNMVLTYKLSQNAIDVGSYGWVSNLGYSMIKSITLQNEKNGIKLKYDKYGLLKVLYNNIRSKELRDHVLWQAGNREELCSMTKFKRDESDHLKAKECEINVLLPLPNMNTINSCIKMDGDLHIEIELEQLSKLINFESTSSVRSSVKLSDISLVLETVSSNTPVDTYYNTEMSSWTSGKSLTCGNGKAAIKEVCWTNNSGIYTSPCTLSFMPKFNSTNADIVTDFVKSILPSLVIVTDDINKVSLGGADMVEVKNNVVVMNKVSVEILVRGKPDDMKVYYNRNIMEKVDECRANSPNINLSLLFKRIICDYYNGLELLVFNIVDHDIDIELASIPLELWKSGTGVSGDNRIAGKKVDYKYIDHFKMGANLSTCAHVNNDVVINYDKNASLFKGTDNMSKLLYSVKSGAVLPSYMSGFIFTFTPSGCIKSGYLDIESGKNIQIDLKQLDSGNKYTKVVPDHTSYMVEYTTSKTS